MEVARPVKSRVHVDHLGDRLVVQWRAASRIARVVSLLFAIVWSAVCLFLLRLAASDPPPEHLLLTLPFLAGWALVAWPLPRTLFGVECLRVGPDGLDYCSRAVIPLATRHIPLVEVQGVAPYEFVIEGDESRMSEHGLKVLTRGHPLRFGRGLAPAEQRRLAERIERHLRSLVPDLTAPPPDGAVEVLSAKGPAPGPPSDCRVRRHVIGGRTVLLRRGHVSPAFLVGLTVMATFWIGVVGLGIYESIGGRLAGEPLIFLLFRLASLVFMLPFAAIGVVLLAAWLVAVTAPLRAEAWAVGPGDLLVRRSFLGLGRTRHLAAAAVARIDLRRGGPRAGCMRFHQGEDDTPYSVGLVGRDGRDLLVFDKLTEGEARCVGGVACDVLKGSLRKGGGSAPPPRDEVASLWDREIDG